MGNSGNKEPTYEYGTKRQGVKRAQLGYVHSIMETFDKTRTGTLNRDEVRALCQSIVLKVAPKIGVLESDIDMVMLVGGSTIKPEITVEDIPFALSAVLALQSENVYFHDLFVKYDEDKSGNLPKDQLSNLIKELNEGVEPNDEDLDYVLKQFEDFSNNSDVLVIKEQDLRAAIISWYLFTEEQISKEIKRDEMINKQKSLLKEMMKTYDLNQSGNLNKQEVREMAIALTKEVAPNIEVLDSDIDMIMQSACGKGECLISIQELPTVLSSVLTLRSQNAYFHELFVKHDISKKGYLQKEQLSDLIQEFNEGHKPKESDLQNVFCEFEQCVDGKISELEIKSAVMKWYFKSDGSAKGISKKMQTRDLARIHQLYYLNKIMETFDVSKTHSLSRDEVRLMCHSIVKEIAPKVDILETDIDLIMRVGGDKVQSELTIQELPLALSSILALQSENAYFHELFVKYDEDKSGYLPVHQLSNLIKELNDGVEPTKEELDYVVNKCDNFGEIFGDSSGRSIHEDELRAAVINWYFKAEEDGNVPAPSLNAASSD